MLTCPVCKGDPRMLAMSMSKGVAFETACSVCDGAGKVVLSRVIDYERGQQFKRFRLAANLGLREASALWGLKPSELCDIEHGKRPIPWCRRSVYYDIRFSVNDRDAVGCIKFQTFGIPQSNRLTTPVELQAIKGVVLQWVMYDYEGRDWWENHGMLVNWIDLHEVADKPALLSMWHEHGIDLFEYDLTYVRPGSDLDPHEVIVGEELNDYFMEADDDGGADSTTEEEGGGGGIADTGVDTEV